MARMVLAVLAGCLPDHHPRLESVVLRTWRLLVFPPERHIDSFCSL